MNIFAINKYLSALIAVIILTVGPFLSIRGCDKSVSYTSAVVKKIKHPSIKNKAAEFLTPEVISKFNPFKGFERAREEKVWSVEPARGLIIDFENAKISFALRKGCNEQSTASWKKRTPSLLEVSTIAVARRAAGSVCQIKLKIAYTERPPDKMLLEVREEQESWVTETSPGFILDLENLEKGLDFERIGEGCSEKSAIAWAAKGPESFEIKPIIKVKERAGADCKMKVTVKYKEFLHIFSFFD